MDLEAARKSLSKKPSVLSTKKLAFIGAACLILAGGIGMRVYHYLGDAPADGAPAAVEAATPASEPATASETAPPPAETIETVAKTPPVPQPAAPEPAPSEPPATQQAAPAPAASEPIEQTGEGAEQTGPATGTVEPSEQADVPGSGMILVSRKPVEVLASPSATAPAMYGFPAGRPFRVIGREGDFVHIQDLRSSASGWIDASALAAPPPSPRAPSVASPSPAKPGAVKPKPATASADPKPKPAKKSGSASVSADSEPAPESDTARRPPGLFGRGGFFGGVFGNGN
jgi:hypothetical protein